MNKTSAENRNIYKTMWKNITYIQLLKFHFSKRKATMYIMYIFFIMEKLILHSYGYKYAQKHEEPRLKSENMPPTHFHLKLGRSWCSTDWGCGDADGGGHGGLDCTQSEVSVLLLMITRREMLR